MGCESHYLYISLLLEMRRWGDWVSIASPLLFSLILKLTHNNMSMNSNREIGREFELYAHKHLGINSQLLSDYSKMVSNSAEGYISPTIIEERQMNVAQMDVFSRLMMDRIIFLGSGINDYVANVVQAQLLFLETSDPGKDISLYINSPGGSVYAGYGIYDTMQYINCDVSTICTGMAASMGAVLLVAGTKGKRYALPHSRVMIHQPLGGAQGQASDMEITVREIIKVKQELFEILSRHTGKSVEEIANDSDRDYWMTADEALAYGAVDKVLRKEAK